MRGKKNNPYRIFKEESLLENSHLKMQGDMRVTFRHCRRDLRGLGVDVNGTGSCLTTCFRISGAVLPVSVFIGLVLIHPCSHYVYLYKNAVSPA
jgi:hypothetical protein